MVLLGIVPVLMHAPPTMVCFSTTATRFPDFAAWMAARCPPGPEPITTRSYVCIRKILHFSFGRNRGKRGGGYVRPLSIGELGFAATKLSGTVNCGVGQFHEQLLHRNSLGAAAPLWANIFAFGGE